MIGFGDRQSLGFKLMDFFGLEFIDTFEDKKVIYYCWKREDSHGSEGMQCEEVYEKRSNDSSHSEAAVGH